MPARTIAAMKPVPVRRPLYATTDATVVVGIRPLLPLRVRIALYEGYDRHDWSPKDYDEEQGRVSGDDSESVESSGRAESDAEDSPGPSVGMSGEAPGLVGDPATVTPAESGFVYVFSAARCGGYELRRAFLVERSYYRECPVADGVPDFGRPVGIPDPFFRIHRYFHGLRPSGPHYLLFSPIELSKERLTATRYGVASSIAARGHKIDIDAHELRTIPDVADKRSAEDLHTHFRINEDPYEVPVGLTPNERFHDYATSREDGHTIVEVRLPDPFREARRRSGRLQQALLDYTAWSYGDRAKIAFVHNTVTKILRERPSCRDYVDLNEHERWFVDDRTTEEKFRMRVRNAAVSLVTWLRDPRFIEVQRDYNFGTDDQQNECIEHFGECIQGLSSTSVGTAYIDGQYTDETSLLNGAILRVALSDESFDDAGAENGFYAQRKFVHSAAALIELTRTTGEHSLAHKIVDKTHNILARATESAVESFVSKRRLPTGELVDCIDAKKVAEAVPKQLGAAVQGFCELVNVALAVEAYRDEREAWQRRDAISLVGALVDLGGAGASILGELSKESLFRNAAEILPSKAKRAMPKVAAGQALVSATAASLAFVSGVIDAFIGIADTVDQVRRRDYDGAIGSMVFAGGGAVVAAASWNMGPARLIALLGGRILPVASGMTGPLGCVVGIGLQILGSLIVTFCNDDEVEQWLKRCFFREHDRLGIGIMAQPFPNLDTEIRVINELMAKFEISAKFLHRWNEGRNTRSSMRGNIPVKTTTHILFEIRPRAHDSMGTLMFSPQTVKMSPGGESLPLATSRGNIAELVGGETFELTKIPTTDVRVGDERQGWFASRAVRRSDPLIYAGIAEASGHVTSISGQAELRGQGGDALGYRVDYEFEVSPPGKFYQKPINEEASAVRCKGGLIDV